jgi:single-strand DNA-binding protein
LGRLGKDPADRVTAGGTRVSHFSLATNRFRSDGNGGTHETTEWHQVVAFGKMAETCNQYLRKGRLVFVEGALQTRSWEKPPGEKHYMTEVVAANVQFLDRGSSAGSEPQGEPQEETQEAVGDPF